MIFFREIQLSFDGLELVRSGREALDAAFETNTALARRPNEDREKGINLDPDNNWIDQRRRYGDAAIEIGVRAVCTRLNIETSEQSVPRTEARTPELTEPLF